MQVLFLSVLAVVAVLVSVVLTIHRVFRAPRTWGNKTPADYGMAFREAWVRTARGKRLFVWVVENDLDAPTVILLHGWGGNAAFMLPLAVPFYRSGMNVVLFDARNHGQSDPDSFSSMPRFAEDLGHVIDWAKQQLHGQIILLGHSVGAAAILLEASRRNDIAAVISIAAFADPEWLMRRFLQRRRLPAGIIVLVLRYVEWMIGHRFHHIAPRNTLCRVKCPVLLVHGVRDRTVPVSDAHLLKAQCGNDSIGLLLLEDADHASVEVIEKHQRRLLEFLRTAGIDEAMTQTF